MLKLEISNAETGDFQKKGIQRLQLKKNLKTHMNYARTRRFHMKWHGIIESQRNYSTVQLNGPQNTGLAARCAS